MRLAARNGAGGQIGGPWRVAIVKPAGSTSWIRLGETPAGIGLWRVKSSVASPINDFMMGPMAEGDDGPGLAGQLDGDFDMESRLEVSKFGRTGNQIQLVIVLHPTGSVVPELMKAVVRRKMGLAGGPRTPVAFADARSVTLGGKKTLFSGEFPEDLPRGEYRVAVELRDEAGNVKQRYERRLVHSGETESAGWAQRRAVAQGVCQPWRGSAHRSSGKMAAGRYFVRESAVPGMEHDTPRDHSAGRANGAGA